MGRALAVGCGAYPHPLSDPPHKGEGDMRRRRAPGTASLVDGRDEAKAQPPPPTPPLRGEGSKAVPCRTASLPLEGRDGAGVSSRQKTGLVP